MTRERSKGLKRVNKKPATIPSFDRQSPTYSLDYSSTIIKSHLPVFDNKKDDPVDWRCRLMDTGELAPTNHLLLF